MYSMEKDLLSTIMGPRWNTQIQRRIVLRTLLSEQSKVKHPRKHLVRGYN